MQFSLSVISDREEKNQGCFSKSTICPFSWTLIFGKLRVFVNLIMVLYAGLLLEVKATEENDAAKWIWKIANFYQKSIIFVWIFQGGIFEQIHSRSFCRGNINLIFAQFEVWNTFVETKLSKFPYILSCKKYHFFKKWKIKYADKIKAMGNFENKNENAFTAFLRRNKMINQKCRKNMPGSQYFCLESFKKRF